MTVFATSGHLVSWAGTAPGANESAGKATSAPVQVPATVTSNVPWAPQRCRCPAPKPPTSGEISSNQIAARTDDGTRRPPTLDTDHHLAHANQRRNLHRRRVGLLHP